jgi:hypothetical protein
MTNAAGESAGDAPVPVIQFLLTPNSTVPVTVGNAAAWGRPGGFERIGLGDGVTDVVTNAELEGLDLDRALAELSFAVTGHGLEIRADDSVLVTLPSLNQALDLRLADGNATLTQTGAETFELAGEEDSAATLDTTARTPSLDLGPQTATVGVAAATMSDGALDG